LTISQSGTIFSKYWIRVYPLLWATSSEALAIPLNLYLVKEYYPQIRDEVRRFVVGVGSYISINGTMICVFVLAGVVASLLGIELSLVDLILCIPLVFAIGFGVPGLPGELILFAGPIVTLLNIPDAMASTFVALYVGFQFGLPDAFRTGNNSTDDCVFGVLLNEVYARKFA
jgi:Na+/H+-dicarboxylate symporter